jgi:hypothetical protein
MAVVLAEPAVLAAAAIADTILGGVGALAAVEAGEASLAALVGEEAAGAAASLLHLAEDVGLVNVSAPAAAEAEFGLLSDQAFSGASALDFLAEGEGGAGVAAQSESVSMFTELIARINAEVIPLIDTSANPVTVVMALIGTVLKTVAPDQALYVLGWLWFMFECYSWSTTIEALPKDVTRLKNHISSQFKKHLNHWPAEEEPSSPQIEDYLHESTQPAGEFDEIGALREKELSIKEQIKQLKMARRQKKKINLGAPPAVFKAPRPHRQHKSHLIVPPTLPSATYAQMQQNSLLPLKPTVNTASRNRLQAVADEISF